MTSTEEWKHIPVKGKVASSSVGAGTAGSFAASRAMKRLASDLKELTEYPVSDVAAEPLDDNLLLWHANVRASKAPFGGETFHFILKFPNNYPLSPPSVDLCTSLPHPNVFPGKFGKRNHICLDMLEDGEFKGSKDKTGWTSAFTVQSLLLQLQSLLLDEGHVASANQGRLAQALKQARDFKCADCKHCEAKQWPPLPSKDAVVTKPKILISRPVLPGERIAKEQEQRIEAKRKLQSLQPLQAAVPKAAAAVGKPAGAPPGMGKPAVAAAAGKGKVESKAEAKAPAPKPKAEEVWVTVKRRRKLTPLQQAQEQERLRQAAKQAQRDAADAASQAQREAVEKAKAAAAAEAEAARKRAPAKPALPTGISESDAAGLASYYNSKTFKRNQARMRRRQRAADEKRNGGGKSAGSAGSAAAAGDAESDGDEDAAAASETKEQKQDAPSSATSAASAAAPAAAAAAAASKASAAGGKQSWAEMQEEEEETKGDAKSNGKPAAAAKTESKRKAGKKALAKIATKDAQGRLSLLPFKVLVVQVLSFLPFRDVARLSSVSSAMREAAEEGWLWRSFFSKKYSASQLTPANLQDWKFTFLMEMNNVIGDLRCFHTKASFQEDVLGIPLEFTVNPRTEQIDYIYSSMDLLSYDAFRLDKIRTTVYKEKFTHWLPLYISADHFERALPLLRKTCIDLLPKAASWQEACLTILAKLVNTMTVLISDKGVQVSERACDGFAAMHRLMLAMVEAFPALQSSVEKKLAGFVASESTRHKEVTPSLGELIPLLAVSEKHTWFQVGPVFLGETLDRNVIWNCKKYTALANIDGPTESKEPDWDRLKKTFEASHVSSRLLCFHVAFLQQFCKGTNAERALRHDQLYGRAPASAKAEFQRRIKDILAADAWPKFFELVALKCPTPERMTDILRDAVRHSLKKGYHNKNTDFSRIGSSGVSRILLKGESYSAPPDLKRVTFQSGWRWQQNVEFLDASVLLYNAEGKHLETIDYSHTNSTPTAAGAVPVKHSGDILDYDKLSGQHTVEIELATLPDNVARLYMVLSGWTCTLRQILQPYVKFADPVKDVELCQYHLDSKNTGANTAVVMCVMNRKATSPAACVTFRQWEVTALGAQCMGRASGYAPILDTIKTKKL